MLDAGTVSAVERWNGMSVSAAQPRQPKLRHLEQLMAQLLDGVILLDPTGIIVSANTAALHMHGVETISDLGHTAEEYAQRFSLRSEEHRPLKHREYPLFRLLAGESFPDLVVEVSLAGDDQVRWVHQARDVVMDDDGGEADYLALVICDVSKRFDAEVRFRAMFQANPAPAIIVQLSNQRVVQANQGFAQLTGFAPDDLIGKNLFGLNLLTSLKGPNTLTELIETGQVIPQAEAELLTADGQRRLVLFAGQPIDVTDDDALLLTFADLEPRRQAQDALAASERHLLSLFEMAPVAIAVTQAPGNRISRVNAAFRALYGYRGHPADDQIGDKLHLWENDAEREAIEREIIDSGGTRERPARLLSNTGIPIECTVSAETISMEGAPCVLWVIQDITERRRDELELADAIDEVMKDASWLSRSILDKLATLRRPSGGAPAVELSRRERAVLDLICDDLDDNAIALQLAISRNTVRNHVANVYAKIGVNRRSGAVVWGRERGMGTRHK